MFKSILAGMLLFAATVMGGAASAQDLPYIDGNLPPAALTGMVHPFYGPLCGGPMGIGPCAVVQRDINFRNAFEKATPPIVGWISPGNPVCQGPLGNAPCGVVRQFLAAREVAKSEIKLPQVDYDPELGDLCIGPFGLGPCEAMREYIALTVLGVSPLAIANPQAPIVVSKGTADTGPICRGPFGDLPCTMLAQASIDSPLSPPPGFNFGLPPGLSGAALAAACAQKVRLDVSGYASCTGKQLVLSRRDQQVLDCAVKNSTAQGFGTCAAPSFGIGLSDEQRVLAGCAVTADGSVGAMTACAGNAFGSRLISADQQELMQCSLSAQDERQLVECAGGLLLRPGQAATIECAVKASDAAAFANCAAGAGMVELSKDQRDLLRCGASSKGDGQALASCLGSAALANSLGQREQDILACASASEGSGVSFAACAAPRFFKMKLSREQEVALRCAAESKGDGVAFGACAATNFFNLRLNPEQQIIVQCVASTGGQPYLAAGCMGSRLTARELTKCLSDGVGGKGCFGDSNDLVGKNGWVARTYGDLAKVPGALSMVTPLLWAGDIDFLRTPGAYFGGSNSFFNKPGQIFGGPNSVFNKPGQIFDGVKAPGKALKKLCGKWC